MFNSTFLLHMGTLQELPNTLSQACSQHRGLHCNNACSMQHSRLLSGQCSRLLQPQLHEIVGVLSSVLTGERSCAHSTQAKNTVQLTANNAHSVKHNAPLSTMVRNLTISSHRPTLDATVACSGSQPVLNNCHNFVQILVYKRCHDYPSWKVHVLWTGIWTKV